MTGLTDVDTRARDLFGKDFVDCEAKSQIEILQALDDELAATRAEPEPRRRRRRPPERNFFFMMKQLTLVGYYTSQIGFEQELHGEIIPSRHARLRPSGRGGGEVSMAAKTYDAIVVGSGITGGWAAKELGEKGLETLVLEAGRPIDPDKDYAEHVPEWEVRYRGMSDRRQGAGKPAGAGNLQRNGRVEQQILRQRQAESLQDRAGQALLVDSRTPGGRPVDHLGTAIVPLERS